jgi:hypothetical protein
VLTVQEMANQAACKLLAKEESENKRLDVFEQRVCAEINRSSIAKAFAKKERKKYQDK